MEDWQSKCENLNQRCAQLLHSGQWTDCTFLVGSDTNQITIKGHKLFLAMASPVFEAMFYGGIPERNDPISILDVQPDAFKALLEYIYTDLIKINSFDKACELCYAAKKYMLPHLVVECTKFLWSDLNPKNACRAYEFAKLFEEPNLMEKCMQIICTRTPEVLSENSFEDCELGTVIKIFEQENLNIESELELFNAAVRYANAQTSNQYQLPGPVQRPRENDLEKSASHSSISDDGCSSSAQNDDKSNTIDNVKESTSTCSTNTPTTQTTLKASSSGLAIKNAVQTIRFLTLTPQQFAEGPARSNLLTQAEAFSILMNISSSRGDHPMPEGFTSSVQPRIRVDCINVADLSPIMAMSTNRHHHSNYNTDYNESQFQNGPRMLYCQRALIHTIDCLNTSVLDCSVNFTVDKNICVIGVQIPTQVLGEDAPLVRSPSNGYNELLYAHLLDADGSRLTYTHYTSRVHYSDLLDITFNRPFYIQRNKVYKVGVVFNKLGWYPMGSGCPRVVADCVVFHFGVGQTSDCIRDGLIRSIIFSCSL